jgi:hypothetical protein
MGDNQNISVLIPLFDLVKQPINPARRQHHRLALRIPVCEMPFMIQKGGVFSVHPFVDSVILLCQPVLNQYRDPVVLRDDTAGVPGPL